MANPPPDKHELMLKLLEHGSVFVHLDPRRDAVVVPQWLRDRSQLVLQIGLNFPIPIRDLEINHEGVRCTLSFNRQPFYCIVPWSAVYALVGEDGQVTVWPTELPSELVPPTEAPQAVRTRKPKDKSAGGKKARATPSLVPSPNADASKPASTPSAPPPPALVSLSSPPRDAQPALAAAASTADASAGEANEATTDDGSPKRFTRSGRELPPWLRVVK